MCALYKYCFIILKKSVFSRYGGNEIHKILKTRFSTFFLLSSPALRNRLSPLPPSPSSPIRFTIFIFSLINPSVTVSVNEKKFIESALRSDLRVNGRRPFDYRKLSIIFRREDGSLEIQLGQTRVMGFVTGQLVQPYQERPNEGTLAIYTEFSPMADPFVRFRESRAVDTEVKKLASFLKQSTPEDIDDLDDIDAVISYMPQGETCAAEGKEVIIAKTQEFLALLPIVRDQITDGFSPEACEVLHREFDFFEKLTTISGALYPLSKEERRAGIKSLLVINFINDMGTASWKKFSYLEMIVIYLQLLVGDDCRQDMLALQLACNAHTICDSELIPFGTGLYPIISIINHSCSPNSVLVFEGRIATVLCKSYPTEFIQYFHYCRSLRFKDKPDYSYLKRLSVNFSLEKRKQKGPWTPPPKAIDISSSPPTPSGTHATPITVPTPSHNLTTSSVPPGPTLWGVLDNSVSVSTIPSSSINKEEEGQFRGRTEIALDQREKFLQRFQQVQQGSSTLLVCLLFLEEQVNDVKDFIDDYAEQNQEDFDEFEVLICYTSPYH
ncbi:unnamed protein product [Lactuca saligna]|uniref:Exoribonuclease phosphorolytic domain-containing protein n=1 Tax=Lactuca saligna TaxID=75948 RepID=A0AA36E6W2_LACSI|nr:unnamed protein product [Lactuca saligna]